MINILCYGDSNTWGYDGISGGRYGKSSRWTGQLSKMLGEDFNVIEEGLNGRTTSFDDPLDDYLNGRKYLPIALKTHAPLDIVIIMLGTNDLKHRLGLNGYDIALGLFTLGEMALKGYSSHQVKVPKVILVTPTYIYFPDSLEEDDWGGGNTKIRAMEEHLQDMTKDSKMCLVHASDFTELSEGDGIHLSEKNHYELAKGLQKYIIDKILPL